MIKRLLKRRGLVLKLNILEDKRSFEYVIIPEWIKKKKLLNIDIYIYIYYMCVCVCVFHQFLIYIFLGP